jgi:hypothetical protein
VFSLDITQLREEWIVYYQDFLGKLEIPAMCDDIHQHLLDFVRDDRLAYHPYFTAETLHKPLDTDPLSVNTIKELLITLNQVKTSFLAIESIPTQREVGHLPFFWNTLSTVFVEFNALYARVQVLNHGSGDVGFWIKPLIDHVVDSLHLVKSKMDDNHTFARGVWSDNRTKLGYLFPSHDTPRALLTRMIILLPDLLRELTEVFEKSDWKIDFNASSQKYKKIEKRFNKNLRKIENASNILSELTPFANLSSLLFKELAKIMPEAAPFTDVFYRKSKQGLDAFRHEHFPLCMAELEAIEEKLGINTNVLVGPLLAEAERLYKTLADHVDKIRILANFSIQNKDIELGKMTWGAIKALVITPAQWAKGFEPVMNLDVLRDERFETQLNQYREERLIPHLYEREKNVPMDFFDFIDQCNHHWRGPKALSCLSTRTQDVLKKQYCAIQPYLVRQLPELDLMITGALYTNQTYSMSALSDKFILAGFQWFLCFLGVIALQMVYVKRLESLFLAMALVKLLDYLHPHELGQIAQCRKQVGTIIAQSKAEADFKINLIKARAGLEPDSLLRSVKYKQYALARSQEPVEKRALGHDFMYRTLFGKMKDLHLSRHIRPFMDSYVVPSFEKWLQPNVFNTLKTETNDLPVWPLSHLSEQAQVYQSFLNALHHVSLCLTRLERAEAHGNPAAWNVYGRVMLSVDVFYAILYDGMSAHYYLKTAFKSPVMGRIAQEGLTQLNELKTVIALPLDKRLTDGALKPLSMWVVATANRLKSHREPLEVIDPEPVVNAFFNQLIHQLNDLGLDIPWVKQIDKTSLSSLLDYTAWFSLEDASLRDKLKNASSLLDKLGRVFKNTVALYKDVTVDHAYYLQAFVQCGLFSTLDLSEFALGLKSGSLELSDAMDPLFETMINFIRGRKDVIRDFSVKSNILNQRVESVVRYGESSADLMARSSRAQKYTLMEGLIQPLVTERKVGFLGVYTPLYAEYVSHRVLSKCHHLDFSTIDQLNALLVDPTLEEIRLSWFTVGCQLSKLNKAYHSIRALSTRPSPLIGSTQDNLPLTERDQYLLRMNEEDTQIALLSETLHKAQYTGLSAFDQCVKQQLVSFKEGLADQERQLNDYDALIRYYDLLNQLEDFIHAHPNVSSQKNQDKLEKIKELKNILNGESIDELGERLQAFSSAARACKETLENSSDNCFMTLLKALWSMLTGWQSKEDKLLRSCYDNNLMTGVFLFQPAAASVALEINRDNSLTR